MRFNAWWVIDTHMDAAWAEEKGRDFDWLFAAQRDGAERLCKAGLPAAWLPLACDPQIHRPHSLPKRWDVSFVGKISPGPRQDLLMLLHQNFPNGFTGQAYFDEYARIYSQSRIGFNRSVKNDVNMRVFETLGCGTLLVTNDLADNGQDDLFVPDRHLVTYHDAEELTDKLRFYLAHEEIRERIAQAGQAEAVARHTYLHRMQSLLQTIEAAPIRNRVPRSGNPHLIPVKNDRVKPRYRQMASIDIIIKTFLRPQALLRLLRSIPEFYPDAHVTIADDGNLRESTDADSLACCALIDANSRFVLHSLPFASGVTVGRNLLIDKTSRPFVLLLDDDFCFTAETKIERFLELLLADPDVGVVAGACIDVVGDERRPRNSGGTLQIEGDTLFLDMTGWRDRAAGLRDYVPQFALIRRDVFRDVRWEGGIGAEHYDFCLQLQKSGWKVAHDLTVCVDHHHFSQALPGYVERRFDFAAAQQWLLQKWNLRRIVQDGQTIVSRVGQALCVDPPAVETANANDAQRVNAGTTSGAASTTEAQRKVREEPPTIDSGVMNNLKVPLFTTIGLNSQLHNVSRSDTTAPSAVVHPPSSSLPPRPPPAKETSYFEHARPEVVALIPATANRVLDIGCAAGRLGALVKERQIAEVVGIELQPETAALARQRLDEVLEQNVEDPGFDFPPGRFDCVVCADILEHLREPALVLAKIRRWLTPDGVLVASLPNVRHYSVVSSLLEGNWTYESAGLLDSDHVRFFTRREIEKILYRQGFEIQALHAKPGPGYDEWNGAGRPGEVRIGSLSIAGITSDDAEEFFTYQYLVVARPASCKQPLEQPIETLAREYPWPTEKPGVPIPTENLGWFKEPQQELMRRELNTETKLVVELGAWLGLSTRFIADQAPQARVITIDHWRGSSEHRKDPTCAAMLPTLFETFTALNWEYRDRILPLKMTGHQGLQTIARYGLQPDIIFIDADHSYDSVRADLDISHRLFPQARLIGDDYDSPDVQRAVDEFAAAHGYQVEPVGTGWRSWRLMSKQTSASTSKPKSQCQKRQGQVSKSSLTSIVLVTHNQLAYTKECVDSIRLRTDEPYELIFVDNNSTDGTVGYLRNLASTHLESSGVHEPCGLQHIRLIENSDNRGFPSAVNQGLLIAHGDVVLLLNNDTVVTTGWLRRMRDVLENDPRIGLVGPCSNCVSGRQMVPAAYQDIGLEAIGRVRLGLGTSAITAGSCRLDTDRLIGFCLAIKRAVIDEIGLFDERFGVGCFEDDDFCLRALHAGWRAVIARDAFIHHYGNRTFQGSGIDLGNVLEINRQKFLDKWTSNSDTHNAAHGRPCDTPPSSPRFLHLRSSILLSRLLAGSDSSPLPPAACCSSGTTCASLSA